MNLTFNKSSELQRFEHGNMIKMLKKMHVWFLAWTMQSHHLLVHTYRLTNMVTLLQLSDLHLVLSTESLWWHNVWRSL